MEYLFTCDPVKNKENIKKHGIDLLTAGELLYSSHVTVEDDRKNYGEERHIAKGYLNGIPLAVVYTIRDMNHIHILSARKLKRTEELVLVQELSFEAKEQKQRERWGK